MTTTLPGMPPGYDDRMKAAVELLGRTGAASFSLRYSDDEQPVIWMAIGTWDHEGGQHVEVDASTAPLMAVLRLCERMIDGGECMHCHRPAGFDMDSLDTMPMDRLICWYQWDPELKTFRRGCEADS